MRLAAVLLAGLAAVVVLVHPFRSRGHAQPPPELVHPRSAYSRPPVVVDVYEYGFHPGRLVVLRGQTVAWKDVGKQFHIITASSRAGRAVFAAAKAEGSASHVFGKTGRYPYHCSLHPWMHGVVIVRARPA